MDSKDSQKPKADSAPAASPASTDAKTPTKEGANPPASAAESGSANSLEASADTTAKSPSANQKSDEPKISPFKKLIRKFDVYFLIFVFLILVSLIVGYIAVQKNKTASTASGISTQTLDQNALKQLNSNDTEVGGTNQTLDVQSDAVFNSNVLIKDSLQVAGSLQIAGSLSLPGITVSGTTVLGQVSAGTLTLTGAETVKGQLTVNQGLTVNGTASFDGPLNAAAITVTTLEINGNITFQHALYTTGSIPVAKGTSALGAGGTASVNGTDTAGEVNVDTGLSPSAGCLVVVNFAVSYATTPYVVITPVGQNAGNSSLGIYITKNFSNFSICSNNPTADTPMSFDYFIIG